MASTELTFLDLDLRLPPFLTPSSASWLLKTAFVTSVLAYLAYYVIYQVYFHPLSNVPGPFLAKLTRLWDVWMYSYGHEHLDEFDLHEKYGPIVRKGPDIVCFNDPAYLPLFYHRNAWKTDAYSATGMFGKDMPPGIFAMQDPAVHAVGRKRIATPFSAGSVRSLRPVMYHRIDHWLAKMGTEFEETGKAFDFGEWAQHLTYDIISDLCFGKPLGCVDTMSDVHSLAHSFHSTLKGFSVIQRLPWLTWIANNTVMGKWWLPKPGDPTGLGRVMSVRDDLVRERVANPEGKDDILSRMLKMKNEDGSTIHVDQVRSELLAFMVAGSDTIASALRSLLISLLTTPGAYDKLMASDYTAENLKSKDPQFPFLTACLRETFRMNPPSPTAFPRYVSKGGITLPGPNGLYVAEGAEVHVNAYVVHRDMKVFGQDALEWKPERWLQSEEKNRWMEGQMFTFGYGTRQCLGKELAKNMFETAAQKFFETYKPTLVNPDKPFDKLVNFGLYLHKGVWIKIERLQA